MREKKILKNNDFLDRINLTILSDHGARIKKLDESYLSVIYAYRRKKGNKMNLKTRKNDSDIFAEKTAFFWRSPRRFMIFL